jgi:hypothetical protein
VQRKKKREQEEAPKGSLQRKINANSAESKKVKKLLREAYSEK